MTPVQALALYSAHNPFDSALARANSDYCAYLSNELVRLLDWKHPRARTRLANDVFRAFIKDDSYPCLGAKASVNGGHYRIATYEKLGSKPATAGLTRDLCAFVAERSLMETDYASFVAVFEDLEIAQESDFERRLWEQLRALNEADAEYFPYDASVSSDSTDPHFAFSFASCAFFVVGMHAGSSRISRRFPWPALVFNAHSQFRALRDSGVYDRLTALVRERDIALQGSLNPNLAEFGERSEARQYSGRATDEEWRCPFHRS